MEFSFSLLVLFISKVSDDAVIDDAKVYDQLKGVSGYCLHCFGFVFAACHEAAEASCQRRAIGIDNRRAQGNMFKMDLPGNRQQLASQPSSLSCKVHGAVVVHISDDNAAFRLLR